MGRKTSEAISFDGQVGGNVLDLPVDPAFILILLAGGALVGLLAGLFGIGGGTFIVPMLYEILRHSDVPPEWRMHVAIGTSLAVIIPVSLVSYLKHKQKGVPDTVLLRHWRVSIPLGVIVGAIFAVYVPSFVLKCIFASVCALTAFRFLLKHEKRWALGNKFPRGILRDVYGFGIGVLSSLMGMGGGIFSAMLMTLYNRSIHQAVATSAGVGVLVSIPGALGYMAAGWNIAKGFPFWPVGFVALMPLLLIAPVSSLFAPLGVRLAHHFSRRTLEIAFAVYLLLIAGRFVATLVFN